MRKGIKILGKVVSTIVLLLIFLPVIATLVLNLESVQNAIVKRASSYASEYLGTDVYIDAIDFDLFSKVRVRGFYVEDYNQDTLLYVAHATANIDSWNIAKDGLKLSNTKAYGAKFYLRELPSGKMNITSLVQQMQSDDEDDDSVFRLYIEDIDAEDLTFCLEMLNHRSPDYYGMDYSNLYLSGIDTHITDFAVVGGAVWMDIERLSMVDRCGFVFDDLATYLYIYHGELTFKNMRLDAKSSLLNLPQLVIKGDGWSSYKRFSQDVRMTIEVESSQVSAEDVSYFVPALRGRDVEIESLSGLYDGVLSDVDIEIKSAKLGAATELAVKSHIKGLSNWREARYDFDIKRLYTTPEDALSVANGLVPGLVSQNIADIVQRVEWVDLKATVGGFIDDFKVVAGVTSAEGDLSCDMAVKRQEDGRVALEGEAHATQLHIGAIVSVDNLGAITSYVAFNGSVGDAQSGDVVGEVGLDVEHVEYGGYTFSNIEGSGVVAGDDYLVDVRSFDSNLKLDLKADISLASEAPTYIASMTLKHADLHALGLNKRDDKSVISANVGLDLQGDLRDGLDGYISLADIEYSYPSGQFVEDRIKIEFDNQGDYKSIVLDSDLVAVEYDSNSTYVGAWNYLYNALKYYVPLLYNENRQEVALSNHDDALNDYTVLNIRAGEKINSLLPAIVGGLVVAPETTLDLRFNPKDNELSLWGESEAVEYKGWIMADWECDVDNSSVRDSLVMRFDAGGLYMGMRPVMRDIDISSGVAHNRMNFVGTFGQAVSGDNSAMLAFGAELLRNRQTLQRNLHIDMSPSYFYNEAERWDMTSEGIDIEPARVSISSFLISRPDQHLVVDGVLSHSLEDAVCLTLNNFDISGASLFTEQVGYTINGMLNGYAIARSAFSTPEVDASISVDGLMVNDINVSPQLITSTWEKGANRAHIVVRDRHIGKNVITGYFNPNDKHYSANGEIANVDVALLKPFLGSVLTDMTGAANIVANIEGEGRKAVLSGEILANSFAATVGYTKTRYSAPTAKFAVKENHILASRVPLYDSAGNVGHLSLDVDLNNLSNVTYDIRADVKKMMVMNTTASDNDSFYGRLFATGEASFKGDNRGIRMDIDVTSADNSKFYLPLQRKEDVSYANFVRFVEPDIEKIDSIDFLTRLMKSYERRVREENTTSGLMDINVNINVLPNIEMQLIIDPTMGNVIKAKGVGELSMHIVPEADIFEMNGDVKITEGTYLFSLQNIISKLFTVVPGSSIHWSGSPMGADVNIDAVYSTKASLGPLIGSSVQGFDTSHPVPVDCYIKLTDKLTSPTPTFDIKVPNAAPEIQTIVQSALNDQHAIATQMFWLLAANSFSADDTGVTGASLSATTGFELLSNQLSNWLSGEDYNIILRYRPRNNFSGDEVDFGFSKSWFNNRLIVELEGGYLSDTSAQAMQKASNFVGEAFITWLIDPEGVLRFKGFTQTIDRYGENQGMQESGIGLYYNESFNTFADLRRSLRKRFSRKRERTSDDVEHVEEVNVESYDGGTNVDISTLLE